MRQYLKGSLLCFITALLIVLSFAPFGVYPLVFVAYIPLLHVIYNEESPYRILFYSWFSMFCIGIMGFQWVYRVSVEFGELPGWAAFLVLLGYSIFVNYKLQLFAMLYYFARKLVKMENSYFLYFIVPGLLVVAEFFDINIFTWFTGNILVPAKYLAQFADFFGVLGLSLYAMIINVCLYNIAKDIYLNRRFVKTMVLPVVLSVSTTVFIIVYGYFASDKYEKLQNSCPLINVAVIQANIGNAVKLEIGKAMKLRRELGVAPTTSTDSLVFKKYEAMTRLAATHTPTPDLIVWPETAFPGDYIPNNPLTVFHRELVKELNIPFIIGGYFSEYTKSQKKQSAEYRYYNSSILSPPYGDVVLYHKYILLPFGEYMPMGNIFPWLKSVVPSVSDFSRGVGASVTSYPIKGMDIRFAPTICYELLIQSYVRKMIMLDANVLLNVTNDSWFGTIEPYQHLGISRMRAIETRRPILRSTNTGISAMVDLNGELVNPTKLGTEEIQYYNVPICDHRLRTFFVQYGYLFPYLLILVLVVSVLMIRRKNSENRN